MKVTITSVEEKKPKIKYPCLLRCGNIYAIATSDVTGLQIDGELMTPFANDEDLDTWEEAGFKPTTDKLTFN